MTEDGLAPATEEVTTEAPATYVGADGTFSEDWTSHLTDESLRGNASLKTLPNVEVLAKNYVNTKSMVGKNTIPIPGDTSDALEWEQYYKAGGRPDTPGDYNFTRPDNIPEEYYSQADANGAMEAFHQLGLSQKQANAIFKMHNDRVAQGLDASAQQTASELEALKQNLLVEWGNAYEQKTHLGNIAMDKAATVMKDGQMVVDEEFKARLVEKGGNDPDIIRAFANLGMKFVESGSIEAVNIPTPGDYQAQIDTIMENPLYLNGTPQQRKKLTDQIMRLREKMNPGSTVSGPK